jgi:hypothetical protein
VVALAVAATVATPSGRGLAVGKNVGVGMTRDAGRGVLVAVACSAIGSGDDSVVADGCGCGVGLAGWVALAMATGATVAVLVATIGADVGGTKVTTGVGAPPHAVRSIATMVAPRSAPIAIEDEERSRARIRLSPALIAHEVCQRLALFDAGRIGRVA